MQITNLLHHPHLIDAVAKMIYDEFWVDVVDAMSLADSVDQQRDGWQAILNNFAKHVQSD